jgi:hypothetical protein
MKKIIFIIAIGIIGSINLNLDAANMEVALNIIGIADGDKDNPISITPANRWFSSMNVTAIFEHNYKVAIGYKGFKLEVAQAQVGFLGTLYHCEFTFFDSCDTGQQKFVSK